MLKALLQGGKKNEKNHNDVLSLIANLQHLALSIIREY